MCYPFLLRECTDHDVYYYSTDNVESMAIAEVVKSKPTPSGSQLSEDMKDDALSETGMY